MANVISFDGYLPFYNDDLTSIAFYLPVYTISDFSVVTGYFTDDNLPEWTFVPGTKGRAKTAETSEYSAISLGTYGVNSIGSVTADFEISEKTSSEIQSFSPVTMKTTQDEFLWQAGPAFIRTPDLIENRYILSNYQYHPKINFNFIYVNNKNLFIDLVDSPGPAIKEGAYLEWDIPSEYEKGPLKRGESVENTFSLYPMPLGTEPITPFTDVSFQWSPSGTGDYSSPSDDVFTVDGTTITISDKCKYPNIFLHAIANGYVYGETENPNHIPGEPIYVIGHITVSNALGIYDQGGNSGSAGGNGSFSDGTSDPITPDIPDGSAESDSSSTGLFTRYAMGASGLRSLAAALYTDDLLSKVGKEILSFLWNSPNEAIISLMSYPFSVSSLVGSGGSRNITFGSLELPVSGAVLAGSAARIDWGSIYLDEYWENFLDYAPHTKIELYLPWNTGYVEIDPNECLPGTISVTTNIEIGKGTCIHTVSGNHGSVIGSYSGVCGAQLPVTAIDTAGKSLALVTAGASALVAGVSGGAATSAGIAAANNQQSIGNISVPLTERAALQNRMAARAEAPYRALSSTFTKVAAASSIAAFRTPAHVSRNGSFNGNGAGLGIQYPFIILSRPTQNVPDNYGHYYGYPSNIYTSLGGASGYTEVGTVHLDGISCTAQEREEIDRLLKGGVIL